MAPGFGVVNGARAEAAERYAAIGQRWLKEFGVTLHKARSNLSGCAHVERRAIEAPLARDHP